MESTESILSGVDSRLTHQITKEDLRELRAKGLPNSLRWLRWKMRTGSTDQAMISAMALAGQPESKYNIIERLKQSGLRLSRIETCSEGHVAYTGDYKLLESCPVPTCGRKRGSISRPSRPSTSYFEHFNLEDYIKSWFLSESYCGLMKYRHEETIRSRNSETSAESWITDYIGGSIYAYLDSRFSFQENDICLQISFDGFQLFKSSRFEAWPVIILNLNLHPSERFKLENVIPYGIIPGPSSPSIIDSFLHPLLSSLEYFSVPKRVMDWQGNFREVRVFLLFVTADTPAINKLIHSRGHNAKHPCRFCDIRGYRGKGSHFYYPSAVYKEASDSRREIFWRPNQLHLWRRSHETLFEELERIESIAIRKDQEERSKALGFYRRASIVLRISTLRAFESFPVDTMHLLFINIPKYM